MNSNQTWRELIQTLKDLTGIANVYYQAPSKMVYPCILVTKENYKTDYSDDIRYRNHTRFAIMLISTDVRTDEIVEKILTLPYCSYNRQYKSSENLIHDVLNIYW